jgi:hypothetical protein
VPKLVGPSTFAELEQIIDVFAREPNAGLIVLADVSTVNYREGVIGLAARHRLPAVYPERILLRAAAAVVWQRRVRYFSASSYARLALRC